MIFAVFLGGCRSQRERGDRVNLGQTVTVNNKPVDPVFKDFPRSWRQFISTSQEMAVPVVGTTKQEQAVPEPIIFSECVFSPEAHGYVPKVTITWNEPVGQVVETPAALAQQRQGEVRVRRFDLGLHHDPFARNFYSSAFSTDKLKRFSLPPNSALVNNPEAVLLTGPGLFPKLMDYQEIRLQDRERNIEFSRQTVVLRELSEGITNKLRVSNLVGREWVADKQIIFTPPVCPVSF